MSNRPSGEQVVAQALQFVGRKYSEMDCQAMVEVAVRACGGEMSYTGSNAIWVLMNQQFHPAFCCHAVAVGVHFFEFPAGINVK